MYTLIQNNFSFSVLKKQAFLFVLRLKLEPSKNIKMSFTDNCKVTFVFESELSFGGNQLPLQFSICSTFL